MSRIFGCNISALLLLVLNLHLFGIGDKYTHLIYTGLKWVTCTRTYFILSGIGDIYTHLEKVTNTRT